MKVSNITAHPTDEIESDVWHLHHLLATLVDLMEDGINLERIQALTWIARDMSKTIGHDMTALNSSIAEGRK